MNFQQYATNYGAFHGVNETDIIKNCIVYKLEKISWSRDIVLKLKNFSKAYDDSDKKVDNIKPLSKSLMKHFKLETPCTVFLTDDSFSVLYGNSYLVYPKYNGSILVVATQYFVKNSKIFENYMSKFKAECVSEGIYYYKSAVIFIDKYDIPYPGGNYFSKENTENTFSRICFILDQQDALRIQEFVQDLDNVNNIYFKGLTTKCAKTDISKFLDPIPVNEINIPTSHYEYTNVIAKRFCYKDPKFILQDILNSCYITENIGIVIEYPICISYVSLNETISPRHYYCFAINCHQPNKFIHVPSPYDRYYQYNHGIKDIPWNSVYYDPLSHYQDLNVLDVSIDTNIIGHVYKDTFFCLSHPKISNSIKFPNRNTRFLINTLSFDIEMDNNLNVIYMNRFDSDFIIYCVKHKNLPYDMFCLKKSKQTISTYKMTNLPYLVQNWATIVSKNQNRSHLNFGDLNFIKLMYILARHKICFYLRESKTREIVYENQKKIIFEVEKNAIDFINNMRLEFISKKKPIEDESKENTSQCSVS